MHIQTSAKRQFPSVKLATAFFVILSGSIYACNIPVFRYALERWAPDRVEVIVFHQGKLAAEDSAVVDSIRRQTQTSAGAANATVREYRIGSAKDENLDDLWQRVSADGATTPYVVVRSTASKGAKVNNWRGPLRKFRSGHTFESPVRRRAGERLLSGTSVVWLVLKSEDKQKNERLITQLTKDLQALSKSVPLPDGIGLPGSELMAEVPLLMKFEVIEIDPQDEKEKYLIDLLQGLAPESVSDNEPLAVPVFGRGRALEVIAGRDVTTELTKDLTMFLCAACSCQVKEMNPGFDLLMSTNWTTELYGEDGQDPTASGFQSQKNEGVPILIDIPAGRKRR
ncbi:MAG: hypothetical protein NXI04_08265 [Planctomycetaceae bacterium]|nr:hypothetical protein [Planctomycetaceae bacterium]